MKSPNVTWYHHRHIDVAELVRSEFAGRAYHCPTVERVDAHLRTLAEHLGPKSNLTESAKERTRRDVDQLLERRMFLRLMVAQAA
jgi:hypothetical protein